VKEVDVDYAIVPVNAIDIAVEAGRATLIKIVAMFDVTEHVN